MAYIYLSPYHDPYLNIAIEKTLLQYPTQDPILYLWVNEPCVIVGRNQNVYQEVNIKYATMKGIKICRRYSGGGAVYQDLGNLNYSLIMNDEQDEEYIKKIIQDVMALENIQFTYSGRNDCLLEQRKFSGFAYYLDNKRYLFHGTMLCNVDIQQMLKVLTPSIEKLKTHAIDSIKSRVINLQEYDKNISVVKLINNFVSVFNDLNEVLVIDDLNFSLVKEHQVKLLANDWIYNDCPTYQVAIDKRINHDLYRLLISIEHGIIVDVYLSSDSLDEKLLGLKERLLNQAFSYEKINKILANV